MGNSRRSIRRKTSGKIDGMEKSTWILFTIFYALFVGILSGIVKTKLPELVYIWGLPLDIQQTTWIFGLALWGLISIFLTAHFKKD